MNQISSSVCRNPPLKILYQDADLIAIDKPSGLLVHRSPVDRWETRFAIQALRDQIGAIVHPGHRLDKATSGILLFALCPTVRADVGSAFEAGLVSKEYFAIVRGWPTDNAIIDHPLERLDPLSADPIGNAQPALTHLRVLATTELAIRVDRYPTSRYALVSLKPTTGRRHQLRRHVRHINHPIIGDTTYGHGRHNRLFREQYQCHRLLLAAVGLTLTHPRSGQTITIHAAPAPDFCAVADRLGWSDVAELQALATPIASTHLCDP